MGPARSFRRGIKIVVVAAAVAAMAAPSLAAAAGPGGGSPFDATVRAVYMMPADKGQKAGEPFVLQADSRATINVGDVTPGTDVSVRVDADQ